jgi:YD repeat-containing protein
LRSSFVVRLSAASVIAIASIAASARTQFTSILITEPKKSSPMSEREQNGLRDLVKTCVEERSYPSETAGGGAEVPERKYSYSTEYDLAGHIIETRSLESDGRDWVTHYTYDASGRLMKRAWGKAGEPAHEAIYAYDAQGRLLNIRGSGNTDSSTFHYDEHGRKTKIQVSHAEDYKPNVGIAGSPFESADRAPNLPGGGTATTIYDENDRPTEVQVRNADGELITRALRTYDSQGRISDEKQIMESMSAMIPKEDLKKMLEQSGASREQFQQELTRVMGGDDGPTAMGYTYDSQGRAKEMHRRIFNEDEHIEISYNDHGDKSAEIARMTKIGGDEAEQNAPGLPSFSETVYSYRYDTHGNWTEQTVSWRSTPDGALQKSTVTRRTLTYY